MIDAGMLPVDKTMDDQEKKPPLDDGTEKPARTTPVPPPQLPDDCSDNKPLPTSLVSSPQSPADGTEKPPPLTPVSSTQIPTTVTSAQPSGPVLSYNDKIVADAQVMYCNVQKALAASKH